MYTHQLKLSYLGRLIFTMQSSSFLIYDASAGSGKTFTLTVDYLSILYTAKDSFAFQRILAITFTNKAVGEMKSRVLEHLIAFSKTKVDEDKQALYKQIQAKTGLAAETIAQKSLQILKYLLGNYASFEISTIDAFTQRIIRTFAKDLGLNNNFEIELEAEALLEEAVDRIIDKVGIDHQLTQILVDFALEKTEDDKSGNISNDVFEASKLLLNEQDAKPIEALSALPLSNFSTHKQKLKKEEDQLVDEISKIGKSMLQLIDDLQISWSSFPRKGIPTYFDKLKHQDLKLNFDTNWHNNIETTPFYNKKTPAEQKDKIDSIRSKIEKAQKHSKKKVFRYWYVGKIKNYITQLSLLNLVQLELDEIKKERNLVLISDFNKKISQQVKQQPAPFIYERLGERFQHYFIDEFQDTSRMQWENLIPLTEEALVNQHPLFGYGSLSLIGDAKQSIYAWRGGDAQQFMDLSQGTSPFSIPVTRKSLDFNYRSEVNIVDFNNGFFEAIAAWVDVPEVKELYSKVAQQTPKTQKLGKVEIDFSYLKNKEEAYSVFPEKVVHTIQNRMASSAVQYSDFCVLVRKKEQGIAIANALNEAQIPIISSETLLISNSKEVQFLMALLYCLEDESHQEKAYEVLHYLLTEKQLTPSEKHDSLVKAFQQKNIWQSISDLGYAFSPQKCSALPLYDAIEYAVYCFIAPENADAYLQFFLDEVFLFSNKQTGDIQSFLTYWERVEQKKSISAPEGENAVQIMTIHKSKGLQFPIVIYPFATEKIDDTQQEKFWIPTENKNMPYVLASGKSSIYKELDEKKATIYQQLKNQASFNAINVLYVTLTRACKELYIFSKYKKTKNGNVPEKNSYAAFFYEYIETKMEMDEDQHTYTFGKDYPFEASTLKPQTKYELNFGKPNLNLSIFTSVQSYMNEEVKEALSRGIILHDLMAHIYLKTDIEDAIQTAILNNRVTQDQVAIYRVSLKQITNHPKLEIYFTSDWRSLNEQEIAFQNGLYRPDRISLKENQAVILDYKTGSPSPNHQMQVEQYKLALQSLGYKVEKSFLVYLHENVEVHEV